VPKLALVSKSMVAKTGCLKKGGNGEILTKGTIDSLVLALHQPEPNGSSCGRTGGTGRISLIYRYFEVSRAALKKKYTTPVSLRI
jgi:hypothetical protein